MKNIMITGGAGFIGSHIAVELLDKDFNVIIYDNLSNASVESLKRVEKIKILRGWCSCWCKIKVIKI